MKKETIVDSEKKRDRQKQAERPGEGDSIKMKSNLLTILQVESEKAKVKDEMQRCDWAAGL